MGTKINNLKWCFLSIIIFFIDQVTKQSMLHFFYLGESVPIIPHINFILAYNKGTAFSLLNEGAVWQFWFLTSIAFVVSVGILIWLYLLPKNAFWQACVLALILGGAIGNVFDRLMYGHVIDFIDFYIGSWHFATFNIADAAITVGAMMLIFEIIFQKKSFMKSMKNERFE